jgi:hypothetical protein
MRMHPARDFGPPAHSLPLDSHCQRVQRLVRVATRPEPIRDPLEVHRVYLINDGHHGLLNNLSGQFPATHSAQLLSCRRQARAALYLENTLMRIVAKKRRFLPLGGSSQAGCLQGEEKPTTG